VAEAKPRVKVPASAAKGEIIEIKTLISHVMETGQRKDRKTGEIVPRQIINKFTCTFNGTPVFSSDWHPAVAANPYLAFSYRAVESGTFHFEWVDDDGSVYSKDVELTVN
jgi:sulfur-oxidizing protein SoxZ